MAAKSRAPSSSNQMSKLPPPPLPPTGRHSLQSLPHEIIELIVEHVGRHVRLGAVKKCDAATLTPAHLCHPDLHALAATCRALFMAAMPTMWRHVTLEILFDKVDGDWVTGAWSQHDLFDLLSQRPTSDTRNSTDSLLNYPYWTCTHAVTLHVRQHEEQLPFPTPWLGALRFMPHLTELSLVFTGYPTSNVTIDLCESEVIGEYLEHHLAEQLANLTVLRIDSSAESSWQLPSFFYTQLLSLPFPSLTKLALRIAQHGPQSNLENNAVPVLASSLGDDDDDDDAGFDTSNMKHLAQLITTATRLTTLELCFSRFITTDVVYAALFHPSIRTVELNSLRISDVPVPSVVGRSQVQTLKFTQDSMSVSHAALFIPLSIAQDKLGIVIFEELTTIQFYFDELDGPDPPSDPGIFTTTPDFKEWDSMLDCLARAPKLTTINCRTYTPDFLPPPSLLKMITTHPAVRSVEIDALWLPVLAIQPEWRALTVHYGRHLHGVARDLRTRFTTLAHLTLVAPLFAKAMLLLAGLWAAGSGTIRLEHVTFTEVNYLKDAKYLPLPLQRVARQVATWRAKRDRAHVLGDPIPLAPVVPARLQCVEDVMRVVVDLPTLEGLLGEGKTGSVEWAQCHFYRMR
ncbi:hypothetical protein AMAG_06672 [Allomyces macrogynus ATCC 38327]|uniref:Uncharacterized protein n=1 Tax=Allomyces macrogynus (strain ATCC 38327) TaxID=578462 RepID=A0A0L0SEK0_ALLM3|nr:hypothetical protein AMAG_06672 [Allomyces macrogynus ATCC 38327]|eukprot:KNE60911.1 hypothetical protein AMAG_06672 [Allomyces macrogynus ATCC 38327]